MKVIGEEIDVKTITKGDASLMDKSIERKFSIETMTAWTDELKKKYPHLEPSFLIQVIDQYSCYPHLVDELVEEHKINPDKFKEKEFDPDDVKYPENWLDKLNAEE